ncbi:MAG TPA: aldo/keto reductase [Thermoanaerobaculia bacterium]|nr:aldo/keto reductase [Thermoanaerobaculia bacterium]
MISGRATLEGTRRFAARSTAAPGHFRDAMGLCLSSLGLGTYLGPEDAKTDAGYEASVAVALGTAVNVFDTAINYRGQKSERAIGRALAQAFAEGRARRDEVFVSTKGGYLPHDADDPRPARRYGHETFVVSGLAPEDALAQGCHCMAPGYLRDQVARSRANLGLETIDLYYLHNVETQLGAVDRATFEARLSLAIETLEGEAAAGRIGAWGLATWDGLRVPPEHPEHLALEKILAAARDVAGERHHFRAVQLPTNMGMAQSVVFRSQEVAGRRLPALGACAALGLAAFGSASILQGRLARYDFPDAVVQAFPEAPSSLLQALQFARSAPGLTTSLVGAASPEHAAEDFALARENPAASEAILGLFV